MDVRTRLGIMSLVSNQMGSVELPEEITFFVHSVGHRWQIRGSV